MHFTKCGTYLTFAKPVDPAACRKKAPTRSISPVFRVHAIRGTDTAPDISAVARSRGGVRYGNLGVRRSPALPLPEVREELEDDYDKCYFLDPRAVRHFPGISLRAHFALPAIDLRDITPKKPRLGWKIGQQRRMCVFDFAARRARRDGGHPAAP
eukprot:2837660-Rhodomonas_salina.3